MPNTTVNCLQGKIAFVSGASRGIGLEIARRYASAGAGLALTARSQESLSETVAVVRAMGVEVWTGTADLGNSEEVRALASDVLRDLGRVDILVNNAGLAIHNPVLDIDLQDWGEMFRLNAVAPLLLMQAFVPGMIARGHGKVINILSRAALAGHAGAGAYSSVKAALHRISASLAVEVGSHNIQVNSIAPTVTLTSMAAETWKPGPRTEAKLARVPAGRFAEPGEVADVALFLASGLSGFVNGAVIPVDGGEGA